MTPGKVPPWLNDNNPVAWALVVVGTQAMIVAPLIIFAWMRS